MRRSLLLVLGLAIAGGALWALMPPRTAPAPVPSVAEAPDGAQDVIVVVACTLRKDQITPYGAPDVVTPFFQRWFAEEGVVFDDAIAASSWTKAGAVALLTGRDAVSVGMVDPGPGQNRRVLSEQVTTLPELMHDAGWETLGVTANPNLNSTFGMAQGFDAYEDSSSRGFARKTRITGVDVVDRAMTLLHERKRPDAPVYLQLTILDPHKPFEVYEADVSEMAPDDVPTRVARYRTMVHRVDGAVERLAERLPEAGVDPDKALWVLVNDHGEGLGYPKHHRAQHGKVLYQSVSAAVWMMHGPGLPAGHRVGGLAAQVDLLPTLSAMLGLPRPEGAVGEDWSAQVRGEMSSTTRNRAYSDTWYYGTNRSAIWTSERQCQLDWGTRGVHDDDFQDGCFDRASDPGFTEVLQDAGLEEELRVWRAAREAEYAAWGDTRDVDVEGDVGAQLEALGYVE